MLALILLGFFAQVGNPIVPPPQPANVTVHNEVTVQVPPPDPQATAEMAGQSFQGIIINVIAPTAVQWANAALAFPDIYRETPPDLSVGNSVIRDKAKLVRAVALGLLALQFLAIGLSWMLGRQGAGEWQRPFLGVALVVGNLVWWEWGIKLNNAICKAIGAPTPVDIIKPHLGLPSLTANPAEAFGPALLVVAYAIVALLLFGAMVFRLAFIDILIVVGALAGWCQGTEWTDRFFGIYVGMATGTLFGQVMVVIALSLAPVLTMAGGLEATLLGLAVLLLARRMPGILGSRLSQSGGGGMRIGTMLLLRRLIARV